MPRSSCGSKSRISRQPALLPPSNHWPENFVQNLNHILEVQLHVIRVRNLVPCLPREEVSKPLESSLLFQDSQPRCLLRTAAATDHPREPRQSNTNTKTFYGLNSLLCCVCVSRTKYPKMRSCCDIQVSRHSVLQSGIHLVRVPRALACPHGPLRETVHSSVGMRGPKNKRVVLPNLILFTVKFLATLLLQLNIFEK